MSIGEDLSVPKDAELQTKYGAGGWASEEPRLPQSGLSCPVSGDGLKPPFWDFYTRLFGEGLM